MRVAILLICILFLAGCGQSKNGKETNTKDTTLSPPADPPPGVSMEKADPVMDTLLKLPFIVKSNRFIDSMTAQQHGISFITDTLENSYEIQAGFNGLDRFETYYHLSIDKKSMEIKVLDPVEGDYIPLKDYLKNNQ
jgi:hypothetical protein